MNLKWNKKWILDKMNLNIREFVSRPRSKLHDTSLFIKREIFDINLTWTLINCRRLPLNFSIWTDLCFSCQSHFKITISTKVKLLKVNQFSSLRVKWLKVNKFSSLKVILQFKLRINKKLLIKLNFKKFTLKDQ